MVDTPAYLVKMGIAKYSSEEFSSNGKALWLQAILPKHTRPGKLTYGGDEGGVERVVGEAEQHACLPYTRISDQEKLE